MDFHSIYEHGFARVAACTARITIADPQANAEAVLRQARACDEEGVAVALFPELCLTGYSIEDLLLQDAVLDGVEAALETIVAASADLRPLLALGAPLRARGRVFNCAVIVHRGHVLGVAPKSYLPTYREFYERRQIAPGDDVRGEIVVAGASVPFGPDLLFEAEDVPGLVVHAEVCEDLWVPIPPSSEAALAGATVLLNLSGSPITVGRAEDRTLLCRAQSSRCLSAYVYSAAGEGESTTDLSWDGQTVIYENGVLLEECERFPIGDRRSVADVDLDLLRQERMRMGTFDDNRRTHAARTGAFRRIAFTLGPPDGRPRPPAGARALPVRPGRPGAARAGLLRGLQHPGRRAAPAAVGDRRREGRHRRLGRARLHARADRRRAGDGPRRPPAQRHPGLHPPGLRHRRARPRATPTSSWRALGITAEEIDIRPTAELMLREIGHPYARGEKVYDVTFENVQAGLRTDYLFRIANQRGGIVLGTGDLSELALGWATYGVGDQMSHYNVNAGVPKTLVQHLIRWVVSSGQFEREVGETLTRILDTEISPELVPGEELQSTESKIGPYALHDFTLFHVLRFGFRPSKIGFLAWHAWRDAAAGTWPPGFPENKRAAYDEAEIRRWLELFCRAFLRVRAVQALGAAERPEGLPRRVALAPRRLAGPFGRHRGRVAARPGALDALS